MFISKETREALTANKPNKCTAICRILFDYIRQTHHNILESVEYGTGTALNRDIVLPGSYAERIEITSSQNEPKIYAFVYDGNNEVLFYSRILETSPEAYGKVASAAGAFLEIYNQYAYYNDL